MRIGRVYMIISPSGRICIGSTSRTFEERWKDYYETNCKKQIHLYNSFLVYGVDNHIFIELWEGDINEMLKQEAILGRIYKVLDRKQGLNCQLPKESDVYSCVSDDTRERMSISAKNKPPISEETRKRHSISAKNMSEETKRKISAGLKGREVSEDTRRKIGKANKGRVLSVEHRKIISDSRKGNQNMLGKNHSQETKSKMSIAKIGKKQTKEHRDKLDNARKKPILQYDLEGNFIKEWESAVDVKKELGISPTRICRCCKGESKRVGKFKFKYKQIN